MSKQQLFPDTPGLPNVPPPQSQQMAEKPYSTPMEGTDPGAPGTNVAKTTGTALVKSELDDMFPPEENLNAISGVIRLPEISIIKDNASFNLGDDLTPAKELYAVIAASTQPNALWFPDNHKLRTPELIGTKVPDCFSPDGITASTDRYCSTCQCIDCKYNTFGSIKLLEKTSGTDKGKACKNGNLLGIYLLSLKFTELDPANFIEYLLGYPYTLYLPPKSMVSYSDYLGKLTINNRQRINVKLAITKITLKKVTEPFTYSIAQFENVGSVREVLSENMNAARLYKEKIADIENILLKVKVDKVKAAGDIDPLETAEGDAF